MNEPATPPPTIGKMGPYTVFITPSDSSPMSVSESPKKNNFSPTPIQSPPVKSVPPVQHQKFTTSKAGSSGMPLPNFRMHIQAWMSMSRIGLG